MQKWADCCGPDVKRLIANEPDDDLPPPPSSSSRRVIAHLTLTTLHGAQLMVSYFLMLIVMTYNWGLFIAVLGGAALGYGVWGWLWPHAGGSSGHHPN